MKKWFYYFGFFGILLLTGLSGCTKGRATLETTVTPDRRETPVSALPTQTLPVSSKCTSTAAGPLLRQGERVLFLEPSDSGIRIIAVDDYAGTSEEIITVSEYVSRMVVSTDGKQLARLSYDDDALVITDIQTGSEASYQLPAEFNIGWVSGWTADGRVRVETQRDETIDAVRFQNFLVDPYTGKIEVQKGQYNLPGYIQVSDVNTYGQLSIDPQAKLALYQKSIGGEANTSKATLIDINSQRILWENSEWYSGIPGWSKDGDMVVFGSLFGNDPPPKILSLSRDGTVSVLSDQLPDPYQWAEYRYFMISPSNRYIHFALIWDIPHTGPGFVLDAETGAFWEICGYSGNLFSSGWLDQSDYLIYQTEDDDENHFFVFDAHSKQTRKLISGKQLKYIGLTSTTALGK